MKKLYVLFAAMLMASASRAQNILFIDTGYTAQQMVTDFFSTSPCVSIDNISYTGGPESLAFFDAANSNLGLNAGLLFTSGVTLPVANHSDVFLNGDAITAGDPTLEALVGMAGFDAAVLEFDFVPTEDTLCFKYVFASEEYNEFVGSGFNDVFAFFLTGPGYGADSNIALIPGSQLPVAINNVNCALNDAYYNCNEPSGVGCPTQCPLTYDSTDFAYDGYTTPLCAKLIVTAGATYHIKLGIQDIGDASFDSGIFLSIESLCGGSALPCVANFLPGFGSDSNDVQFDNESIYGSSWTWDFGDGYTSTEKNPQHEYTADGTYTVKLVTCNFSSCDTTEQTITIGTTGMSALALSDITVYPNPATNVLNVRSIGGNAGTLSLFDAAGRMLLQQELNGNALVDVSSLTNGVYTVELLSHKGVHRTRFYKQ